MRELFGETPDGRPVDRFTLRTPGGISATVLTLGGILQSLHAPDRAGAFENVTLGCPSVDDYLAQDAYLGAVVGRCANRIADGRFTLDGIDYDVSLNEPPHSLHGGVDGFHRRLWTPVQFKGRGTAGVLLALTSPDGDQGYPGAVNIWVRYQVTDDELWIDYMASTDQPTIVNPTSHAYWNLGGEASGSIEDHLLWINATHFTPVDASLIPTGAIDPVLGTPFDFYSAERAIGPGLAGTEAQLAHGQGYDHNFALDQTHTAMPRAPRLAARVVHPDSGRVLELLTTEPGLQFYSGNRFDGSIVGPKGARYEQHAGLALEAQTFPDAPHHPQFPTAVLRPGRQFRSTTIYRFSTLS